MQSVRSKQEHHASKRVKESIDRRNVMASQKQDMYELSAQRNSEKLQRLENWKKRLLEHDKQKATEKEEMMAILKHSTKSKSSKHDEQSLHDIFERARALEREERLKSNSSKTADALHAIQEILRERKNQIRTDRLPVECFHPRYREAMSRSNYARSTKLAAMVYHV